MDREIHRDCQIDFGLDAATSLPAVESKHNHFVAPSQMFTVMGLPELPFDWETVTNQWMTMNDW